MLGSVSEAEDVVQEGFLRLHRARAGGERERRSEAVVRGETLPMCGGGRLLA
jgi:Sigma-70 region 2